MKAVLDVGQFVSATIRGDGHPAQVMCAWRDGEFELYISIPILEDLRRVLGYRHIRKRHGWSDEEIDIFILAVGIAAHLTEGERQVNQIGEDPTDDKILACAEEGDVDYIVASDEHLMKEGNYKGMPIVTPRQFLEILKQAKT